MSESLDQILDALKKRRRDLIKDYQTASDSLGRTLDDVHQERIKRKLVRILEELEEVDQDIKEIYTKTQATFSTQAIPQSQIPDPIPELEQLIARKQTTLNVANRALSYLETDAAAYPTLEMPVKLRMDLDDKRAEVERIEREINKLQRELRNLQGGKSGDVSIWGVIGAIAIIWIIVSALLGGNTTDQTTNTVTPVLISPIQSLQEYYDLINAQQIDEAWARTTAKYREGISQEKYRTWWETRARGVQVRDLKIEEQSQTTATVKVDVIFDMRDGPPIIEDRPLIHLVFDTQRQIWLIDWQE